MATLEEGGMLRSEKTETKPPVPPKLPIPPPQKDLASPVVASAHEFSPQAVLRQLDSEVTAIHEMPQAPHSSQVLPEWVARAELEAQSVIELSSSSPNSPIPTTTHPLPSPSSPSSQHSISRKTIGGSPGPSTAAETSKDSDGNSRNEEDEQGEERLKVLRDRIDRIRADKERLLEIQRLSLLEEETKEEILEVQRRVKGN